MGRWQKDRAGAIVLRDELPAPWQSRLGEPHELTQGSLILHPLHRPKATLYPCPGEQGVGKVPATPFWPLCFLASLPCGNFAQGVWKLSLKSQLGGGDIVQSVLRLPTMQAVLCSGYSIDKTGIPGVITCLESKHLGGGCRRN